MSISNDDTAFDPNNPFASLGSGAVLTPVAGVITPTATHHHVAAGTISSIATTNVNTAGHALLLLTADGAVTITLGSSIVGRTTTLSTDDQVLYILDSSVWREIDVASIPSTVANHPQLFTGGIRSTAAIGSGTGVFRADSCVEASGTTGAMSVLQTSNPGNTSNESFYAWGAYDSGGTIRKTASLSSMWAVATAGTGYAVLRFNSTLSGGTVDDVAFRIFGGHGCTFFGGADDTPSGAAGLCKVRLDGDLVINPNAGAARVGSVAERGRVKAMGEWTYPTFSAGVFTAGGTQTWTVASGDVNAYGYRIIGKSLSLSFYLQTTTVAGTPHPELHIAIPDGYTVAKRAANRILATDNGTEKTGAWAAALVGNAYVTIYADATGGTNWSPSTDATSVIGQIELEVV